MSQSTKKWCLIASILVALGLIIFTGVIFAYDWDFSKLSTVTYETNTYKIDQTFDSISIDVDASQITLVPTDDETCRLECYELEKVSLAPTVQDGVLTIKSVDTRKWYDYIGISLGSPKITVYLPNDQYTDLFIETDTGDVLIPKDLSFRTLKIEGNTADINCLASVSQELQIETDTGSIKMDGITAKKANLSTETGRITLQSVTVENRIALETDTGKTALTDVLCGVLQATSDTGDIYLTNVVASDNFSIETDTGDVTFDSADAREIFVQTNTGDVTGNLLTDKVFIAETDTGRVQVPKTVTGGRCEIVTDTGDIQIEIEK